MAEIYTFGRNCLFRPKLSLSAEIISFSPFRLSAEITSHENFLWAFGRKCFGRSLPGTHQPALRHRTNMKNKFEVNLEDVPSGEIVKSTLQVGKYDVKDEVDIMVDALQLKS